MLPIARWGTFGKAIRITKLVMKFIHKIRKQVMEELEYRKIALNHLIKQVQQIPQISTLWNKCNNSYYETILLDHESKSTSTKNRSNLY